MALSTLEQNTINKAAQLCKLILDQVKPQLDELDTDYNSGGGVKSTVTQGNLDLVSAYSGLTKAQLDDALFALTSTLKTAIVNAYAQLEELANRA